MTDPDFATLRHLREQVVFLQSELRSTRAQNRENMLKVCNLEQRIRAMMSPARRRQESSHVL